MSLILDEHREYLADSARVGAFRQALQSIVRPGDVGLDLASGTGILGLLACQAGASRVYAVEGGDIASAAGALAAENGFGDRIRIIHEHSSRATLPEQVDFVVTDMAGRFGFEAGLFELLHDAKRRFLKPGGRVIPRSVALWVAPVESPGVRARVDFWSAPVEGLSFGSASPIARSTGYPHAFQSHELLAAGQCITGARFDGELIPVLLHGRVDTCLSRSGTIDGIAGWFSSELADNIELTNAPGHPQRINRRNVFFPLSEPVDGAAGDRISMTMSIRPEWLIVRWLVEVWRGDRLVHRTDTSTFTGMLLSKRNIERVHPEFMPALTEAGRARRTVVNLCDGAHTIREIEAAVFEQHPSLFRDASDAAIFVAEVVTRYAT